MDHQRPGASDDLCVQNQPAGAGGRWRRLLREWAIPLVVAGAVLTTFRSAVADWCDVPTGSMEPTILPGDRIMVNRLAFGLRVPLTNSTWVATWGAPARGEVVVLHSPVGGTRLVKRIVGVPGDVLEMRNNRLIVNGVAAGYGPLDAGTVEQIDAARRARHTFSLESIGSASHAIMLTPGVRAGRTFGPVTIPAGRYFVMGDSRDNSADSRAFGLVARELIVGRSSVVALSLDPQRGNIPRLDRLLRPIR